MPWVPRRRTAGSTTRRLVALLLFFGLLTAACTGTSDLQVERADGDDPDTEEGTDPETSTTSTTAPPDCAQQLPPAAQAGQMLMVMVTAPEVAGDALARGRAGGFGLKGRQSARVGDEVANAVANAPVPPFVAGDEEGGSVQRLAAALGVLYGARKFAEGHPQDAGRIIGDYAAKMAELGFNMNFAPVADLGTGSDLGTRTFGDDPATVAPFVEAIVAAQEEAGIISVVKHWPGIGRGGTDPHVELSALGRLEELRASDMTVFDRAIDAGAPAIMVGHGTVEGLTGPDEPVSLSRAAITEELRGRQGFDGLVITDSLGMGAVVNTIPQDEAAERAIAAGADIALVSGADVVHEVHLRLTEAIMNNRIPSDQVVASVRRILGLKGVTGPCVELVAGYTSLQNEVLGELQGVNGSGPGEGSGTGSGSGTEGSGGG